MTVWQGYFGIENLGLSGAQRATLIDALKALGPAADPQPARRCHWRTRLDGEAVILEALFDGDELTVARFKERLAAIFGVAVVGIGHAVQQRTFAGGVTPVVTFGYGGTERVRFALFGGVDASWQESGDECRGYLGLNAAEWDGEEE